MTRFCFTQNADFFQTHLLANWKKETFFQYLCLLLTWQNSASCPALWMSTRGLILYNQGSESHECLLSMNCSLKRNLQVWETDSLSIIVKKKKKTYNVRRRTPGSFQLRIRFWGKLGVLKVEDTPVVLKEIRYHATTVFSHASLKNCRM